MLHNSMAKPDEETEKTVETNSSIDESIESTVLHKTEETD